MNGDSKEAGERRSLWALVLAATLPIALVPWLVRFWPSQDDPNNLAVTHILQHLRDPGSPFASLFDVRLAPRPYMLQTYLHLALGTLVSLPNVGRIMTSAIIVSQPLVALFALERLAPSRRRNALFLAPITTGLLLFLGFTNFLLGMEFGILMSALLLPAVCEGRSTSRVCLAVTALFGLLAALAHPLALMAALAFALLASGRKIWRGSVVGALIGAFAPAFLFLVWGAWYAGRLPAATVDTMPGFKQVPYEIWSFFIKNNIGFSWGELPFRLAVTILFVVGAVRTIRRVELRAAGLQPALARIFLALIAACVLLPDDWTGKVYFLVPRYELLALIFAATLADPPRWLSGRRGVVVATASSVAFAAALHAGARAGSARVEAAIEIVDRLPRGGTLLPLNLRDLGAASVNPELHAWSYFVIERDVVTPYLFVDGGTPFFGGIGYRSLVFRRPFSAEFMPWIELEQLQRFFRFASMDEVFFQGGLATLLRAGAGYDRVLLVHPSVRLVRALQERWPLDARVGDSWLFRSRAAGARE